MLTLNENLTRPEQDAAALIEKALYLAQARDSGDELEMVSALDENLQLWIAIKSLMSKENNFMPSDIRQNLIKLADFVAQKTFEYGPKIPQSTLETIINSNLQISEGLLSPIQLSPTEQEALTLIQSAFSLAKAREEGDMAALTQALDDNLKIWVFIKTIVKQERCTLPEDTKHNLVRLCEFVTQKTFELSNELNDKTIEAMINTNLQIAEGLLEGAELKPAEQDALELLKAAVELSNASESGDVTSLVEALDQNLQLWVNIKTVSKSEKNLLSSDVKKNLCTLADFVAQKTFEMGGNMTKETLNTLINTNLQISEGLLEKSRNLN